MHEPRPYGLLVKGSELTPDDMTFIDQCCKKVSNFKQISSLESLKYTRELPDGGYIIISDAGGVFRAIAYKPPEKSPENPLDGVVKFDIPMLFSGAIDNGVVRNGNGVEVNITNACKRRLGGYENEIILNGPLKRFRCEYDEMKKEMFIPQALKGLSTESVLFSQYDKLKSTWYSGAMAEVVQIASGFGRQDFDNLPEDDIERAVMKLPEDVLLAIQNEIGENVRLPGYSGLVNELGKITYDFTFDKTHLVSFDSDRKPWLVQVDSLGVWAMPLPIIPATRTQAFYEYVQDVGDDELEKILLRFGAIPSGDGFPANADFFRWVRAGVIIKVCDTADFHTHSAYSTACGWSCNLSGTHLVNTCYDYVDKYCHGYTYQIRLQLEPAENSGWVLQQSLPSNNREQLSNYLSQLFTAIEEKSDRSEHLLASIKYKLRRVSIPEIEARSNRHGEDDIEYWDSYVCKPIATHRGTTLCTNDGHIMGGVCFKLPEPHMEGCVSMDFSPIEEKTTTPKFDTIIFAYFIKDDLKVIKNFHDERKSLKKTEGSFEPGSMVVGSWEQTEYIGATGLAGNYYSTDFDHRQEIAPTEKYTKIIGRDLGYGQPLAMYHAYYWMAGRLSRQRYYTHKTNIHTKYEKAIAENFIVPYYQRNAAIYGEIEKSAREYVEERLDLLSAEDPNSYEFWTYDWVWHSFDNTTKSVAKPFPVEGYPIWSEVHFYNNNNSAQSEFADEGDWIGPLPAEVTRYVSPISGVMTLSRYGGEAPTAETYEDHEWLEGERTYNLQLSLVDVPKNLHTRPHDENYYSASPDQFGNVIFEDACKVVFGDAEYANVSIKDEANRRYRFGYSRLANNDHAHTFIGVINE